MKKHNIRCSVISVAAEVRVCRALCKATGGKFNVMLDENHFQDLVHEHVEPPPLAVKADSSLIKMGSVWTVT
jgi:transcription initiation factor TFIIH subunit 2